MTPKHNLFCLLKRCLADGLFVYWQAWFVSYKLNFLPTFQIKECLLLLNPKSLKRGSVLSCQFTFISLIFLVLWWKPSLYSPKVCKKCISHLVVANGIFSIFHNVIVVSIKPNIGAVHLPRQFCYGSLDACSSPLNYPAHPLPLSPSPLTICWPHVILPSFTTAAPFFAQLLAAYSNNSTIPFPLRK